MKTYNIWVKTNEGWAMYSLEARHMREVLHIIESKQYMWILDAIEFEVKEEKL